MMKAVLLENELYSGAMTDLLELRDAVKNGYLEGSYIISMFVTTILNKFEEAASIAGHSAMENAQFEIMNSDPETFMEIEYGDESES